MHKVYIIYLQNLQFKNKGLVYDLILLKVSLIVLKAFLYVIYLLA